MSNAPTLEELVTATRYICFHYGPPFTRSIIRPHFKEVDQLSHDMLFHMIERLPPVAMYSIIYLWGGSFEEDDLSTTSK
jgi:hypothetical protein